MSDLVKMSDIINIYNTYDSEEAREQVMKLPSINAVIIPDNATNGDMIKALFPNAEYWDSTEFENEERINFEDNDCLECLNLDWWNTPYKLSELKGE